MLSYLHAFHAGGHADVLKHTVLLAILRGLTSKDKPLRYVETHAGAGGYDLRGPQAQKNREFAGGIELLWNLQDAPPAAAALLGLARRYNGEGRALANYPGSPWLARESLRAGDSLYLFELHPAEHRTLARNFAGDRRVTVLREEGLAGSIGLVPPPERRALVFIDPSYEVKDERERVVETIRKAHRRFATGVYAVWYPVFERHWVDVLERALRAAGIGRMWLFELQAARDARDRGLTGSGVVVVNPPWKLREEMEAALPWLAARLGVDGAGGCRVIELAG
ncbi:MAG TPA: 23S rRNA (adenine(2030)-N(6))-methyltransferase RlmJ [Gammaproteobacteria bacterium]|nr:23S rRNA (adenine(2030)-N(6))-methyltransferase RlmJ [Gammaproteobacteria bacterium]